MLSPQAVFLYPPYECPVPIPVPVPLATSPIVHYRPDYFGDGMDQLWSGNLLTIDNDDVAADEEDEDAVVAFYRKVDQAMDALGSTVVQLDDYLHDSALGNADSDSDSQYDDNDYELLEDPDYTFEYRRW